MPNKLYKYRPFGVLTLRCITEAEVFYAAPKTFNDPMDCDPTIEVDVDRSTLEKLHHRLLLRRMDEHAAVEELEYIYYVSQDPEDYRNSDAYVDAMLARAIKSEVDAELGTQGVLSLSAVWSSALMWSHYADEHRGICIEYDTTDDEHPQLMPVDYRAPRAIKTSDLYRWKVLDDADAKSRVTQTYFYAKSKEWKYEKEWRDLRDKSGAHGVPFRITAIHFGLRCDRAVITSVVKLLNNRRTIKLYSIHPKGDTFRLSRALIDRDEIERIGVRDPAFLVFKDVVWDVEDTGLPRLSAGAAIPAP